MSGPGRGRIWAFGLLALALSGLVGVAVLELGIRLLLPQPPSWLGIYRHHPTLPIHALQPEREALVSTGETRWHVTTDARGRRIPADGGNGSPSACRSLWIGDSFAFGHGVDYDESWIGVLAGRSTERAQLNAAVPGYGPQHYAMVAADLEAELRRGDTLFVASYLGNDFHDVAWHRTPTIHEGILGHEGDLKSFLKTRLHLYRLASGVLHALRPGRATPYETVLRELGSEEAWQRDPLASAEPAVQAHFHEIATLARRNEVRLRVLLVPTRDAVLAERGEATLADDPRLPARRLGAPRSRPPTSRSSTRRQRSPRPTTPTRTSRSTVT